jgi:glycosyltransferase involved in cell wall biosynthesis
MYRVTIFHYHLQTGGITQVIRDSVLSLLKEEPDKFDITVVSGREEQSGDFLSRLHGELEQSGVSARVRLDICPLLDYTDTMESLPQAEKIKKELLSRYRGSLWWVHNYHIGKNPVFTGAILEIAREYSDQGIVLHIHDFPESGRFANLQKIRDHFEKNLPGENLYPDLPNLRYVLINNRDREILVGAGIREERVFLLNNPIRPADRAFIDLWQVQNKVNRWAEGNLPFWQPWGKLVLYPVRTIRRKNVLEAALLVNLLDTPSNLLVTLPGNSDQERHYSDLVARAFSEKLVPGVWAVGTRLEEFDTEFRELTRAADLIISTSVQEGFGYLFINSLLWGVPLLARNLDILDGIKNLFAPGESCFYDRLIVPLSRTEADELAAAYRAALEAAGNFLPKEVLADLTAETERMLKQEWVDFSFLTPQQQYEELEKIHGTPAYREKLRELNAELVSVAEDLLRGGRIHDPQEVFRLFGPAAHTAAVIEILESFSPAAHVGGRAHVLTSSETTNTRPREQDNRDKSDISYKVLKSFSHIDYLRPLYFA